MKPSRIIAATAAILAATAGAWAENLSTEITVSRTIIPAERAATRLAGIFPAIVQPEFEPVTLEPAEYSGLAEIVAAINSLDAAPAPMTTPLSNQRGYLVLVYFPTYNLGASAGYRLVHTDRTRVDAWMQFDGSLWHTNDGARNLMRNNTLTIGVDAHQRVGSRSQLSLAADFTRAWLGEGCYAPDFHQGINMGSASARWWTRTRSVAWHASAGWQGLGFTSPMPIPARLGRTDDASEQLFNISGGAVGTIGTERWLGIEIDAQILRQSGQEFLQNGAPTLYNSAAARFEQPIYEASLLTRTNVLVGAMPYFSFRHDRVLCRVGARLDVSGGGRDAALHVSPQVMATWNPSTAVAIYATIDGGNRFNTLRSLYDYCPYIASNWIYERSHVPVDATLGVNLGPIAGVSLQLRGGYAVAHDWLMPTRMWLEPMESARPGGVVQQMFRTEDLDGWHAGATLGYAYRDIVSVSVSADFAAHGQDSGYYMWRDRASTVIAAEAEVHPIARLTVGARYEFRGGRHCYEYTPMAKYYSSLGCVSDLGLSAEYAFSESLTATATVENLLGRRYYMLPGVQSQGVHGLVGVAYKF